MAANPYPGYLTPAQQIALAKKRAADALLPGQTQITNAQAAAQKQTDLNAQQAMAVAKAVAEISQGVAPRVEQTYHNAGTDQASFAKGLADGERLKAEQAAGQSNDTLRAIGADDRVLAPKTGGADASYATGGYLPAVAFSREGAAAAAEAEKLPAYAAMQGQANAATARGAGLKTQDDLRQQLLELEAKRPGLINDLLSQIEGNQHNLRGDYQNERIVDSRIGAEGKPDTFTGPDGAVYTWVKKNGKWVSRKVVEGAPPKAPDSKPPKTFRGADGYTYAWAKNENDQWVPVVVGGPPKNGKKQKFTAGQIAGFTGDAVTLADNANQGHTVDDKGKYVGVGDQTKDENGKPIEGYEYKGHLSYTDAVRLGRRRGIPLSILVAALNEVYPVKYKLTRHGLVQIYPPKPKPSKESPTR